MFAALIGAVSLLASNAAPAQAAAAPANQPMRQVAFKVTEGTRTYSGAEHYQGFSSQSTATADKGTVTVAIVSVQNDALGMNVTELMNSTGHESMYAGTVFPDGGVSFAPQTIQEVTREILQYFGPQFIPLDVQSLDVGKGWNSNYSRNGLNVTGEYKVVKIDGPLLTLAEKLTVKVPAQNVTMTTDGTVTLKPSLLVPISGDVHRTIRSLGANGATNTDLSLHFERISDTRDTTP